MHRSSSTSAAHRGLLQSSEDAISALETKLLALVSSFHGASPCNNTELARAYYNGTPPVLNGDRQYYCVNYSVGSSDNIDAYLTSNSASWASLPLFHILVMNNYPVVVRQTPAIDVDRILAADVQYQLQQYTTGQASWQQQLQCVNASVVNRLQLHELTALVEASLAVEGQMSDAEILTDLYEQLLESSSNGTLVEHDQQRREQLALQLSQAGAPVGCTALSSTAQSSSHYFVHMKPSELSDNIACPCAILADCVWQDAIFSQPYLACTDCLKRCTPLCGIRQPCSPHMRRLHIHCVACL